ncbi:hypothetical protein KCP76_04590 [Salmonella enterica subsp. enterica serovar Weltevreden]|nr:hypothetical protein KCP76_04590 [Salmonella enterica subsp. enterica serovar Weltevreden]
MYPRSTEFITPVEVWFTARPSSAPPPLAHYDIMILSVPVTFREPLTMQHERSP